MNDPRDSARAAEGLVLRALEERGYPHEEDSDRLVALVSVAHPDIADRYRHGHAMLENVDGEQTTENLARPCSTSARCSRTWCKERRLPHS